MQVTRILPNNHQLLTDAKTLLSSELERLVSLGSSGLEPTAQAAIIKQSAALIAAVQQATKAIQAIKDVEASNTTIDAMSDKELEDLLLREHVRRAAGTPLSPHEGEGRGGDTTLSEPGANFGNDMVHPEDLHNDD